MTTTRRTAAACRTDPGAVTLEPARLSGWEAELGSIEAGKLADFVVLSGRVPQPVDRSLLEFRVAGTWVGGQQVYRRIA